MSVGDTDYTVDHVAAAIGGGKANGNGHAPVATVEGAHEMATMDVLDTRTIEILKLRRAFRASTRRRGWLVRRMLVFADVLGLAAAFIVAQRLFPADASDRVHPVIEYVIFLAAIPVWIIAAHVGGLYKRDGELTDHSTADDLVGVFVFVTVGTWLVSSTAWLTDVVSPNPPRIVFFWGLS